jgi:hypothetical protein
MARDFFIRRAHSCAKELPFRFSRLTSRDFRSGLSKNGIELIRAIANDVFFGPL